MCKSMGFDMSELYPGVPLPHGERVAMTTLTHVWVHTVAGLKAYPIKRPEPTSARERRRQAVLHVVPRRAA